MKRQPLTVAYQSLYGHKDTLDQAMEHILAQAPIKDQNQLLSLLMLYHNTLYLQMHSNLHRSFQELAQVSTEEQHALLWGTDTDGLMQEDELETSEQTVSMPQTAAQAEAMAEVSDEERQMLLFEKNLKSEWEVELESEQNFMPMPETVSQAELMQKVGYAYLEEHAPERLIDIEKIKTARDNAIQQAKIWAQEARTQQSIVKEIGALVDCDHDWETIGAVRDALNQYRISADLPEAVITDCIDAGRIDEEDVLAIWQRIRDYLTYGANETEQQPIWELGIVSAPREPGHDWRAGIDCRRDDHFSQILVYGETEDKARATAQDIVNFLNQKEEELRRVQ